jgi:hypothetical protein
MSGANRKYDEGHQLCEYIWRYYDHLLTGQERALCHAVSLELRARHARSYEEAEQIRKLTTYFFDEDVAEIAEHGLDTFRLKCCDRLLEEYGGEIYINRCERCRRIVVSPISCACLWCGHHWYERRSEMIAKAGSSIYPKPS